MPLHLLGKKSWNVYNQVNIDKVRRDEAAAELRAREDQRLSDKADAESRLQLLRGEGVVGHKARQQENDEQADRVVRASKKTKLVTEDETDTDRWQAQKVESIAISKSVPPSGREKDASMVNEHVHFSLFPETDAPKSKGNTVLAKESAKRQQDFEDKYTMRLANAAGRTTGSDAPWYSVPAKRDQLSAAVEPKNVWGKADPQRNEREKKRVESADPLASIKKGVKQLREAEKHREEWRAERERDLNEVEELARKHKHRRKRRRLSNEGSLDGFDLNAGYDNSRPKRQESKRSSGSHRRHHKQDSKAHRHDGGRS